MDNSYLKTNNRYTQAKDFFKSYTSDFVSKSNSGIISNKSIRKLNVIGVWLDYIQKYLKDVKNQTLHETEVTYKNLNDLLDIIAFEFKITYQSIEKLEADNKLSSINNRKSTNVSTHLEDDKGTLLTERGKPIEVEDQVSNESLNSSTSSSSSPRSTSVSRPTTTSSTSSSSY
jgi:hypothetical protein